MKEKQSEAEIKLQERLMFMQSQIDFLEQEQKQFQDALLNKCAEIDALPPVKRFFNYGRLLWELIALIFDCIEKLKQKKANRKQVWYN
jgi:hypothetical protein